ncbi:hypothetical protein PTKIN_Ptkin04bG0160800 [Pterospermum kingtungense]
MILQTSRSGYKLLLHWLFQLGYLFKVGLVTLLTLYNADYGQSFPGIVQGLEHVLENLSLDQISVPSSFKYRIALEKQLTATMLHVLSLAPSTDHQ